MRTSGRGVERREAEKDDDFVEALKRCGVNAPAIADELGIGVSTAYRKILAYGLKARRPYRRKPSASPA